MAQAKQADMDAARAAYADIGGTTLDSCTLCHTASFGKNSYGQAYKAANKNFAVIENRDSDGDGFSNIEEILALTFPGDPSSKPSQPPPVGFVIVTVNGPASVNVGQEFEVSVVAHSVEAAQAVYGAQFELNFDAGKLQALSGTLQPALEMNPYLMAYSQADNSSGNVALAYSRQGDVPGLSGDVTLASVRFRAIAATGSNPTNLSTAAVSNSRDLSLIIIPKNHDDDDKNDDDNDGDDDSDGDGRDDDNDGDDRDDDDDDDDDNGGGQGSTTISLSFQPESLILGTKEAGIIPVSQVRPLVLTINNNGNVDTASATGQVYLAHGLTSAAATVNIEGTAWSATTASGGDYTILNITPGVYDLKADAPLHLSAICTNKQINAPTTQLAAINLPGGDLNDDDVIDISDATIIGVDFGTANPRSDINLDGQVNVLDLIILANNYQAGSLDWKC